MTKIEAVIQPYKFDDVLQALMDIGIEGMTVTDVIGYSRHEEHAESYRGSNHGTRFVPKLKVEIVVADADVDAVAGTICRTARTGRSGDGNVFIVPVGDAFRIRNCQYNEAAL